MKNGKIETISELIDITLVGAKFPKLAKMAEDLATIQTWIAAQNCTEDERLHLEHYILAVISDASSMGMEHTCKIVATIAARPGVKEWGRGQHSS